MATVSGYSTVVFTPPFVIVGPLIVFYNLLAVYLVYKRLDRKSSRHVPPFVSGIIEIFFRGALKSKRTGPKPMDKEYQLFKYPAPAGLVNALGLLTVLVWINVTIAFFSVFLEGDFECSNYDYASFSYPEDTNISNYIATKYTRSTRCLEYTYKGSYNYIKGISAVGGTLILITLVLHTKLTVVMWMLKRKNRSATVAIKRRRTACLIITEVIVQIAVMATCFGLSGLRIYGESNVLRRPEDVVYDFVAETLFDIAIIHASYFSNLAMYFNWKFGHISHAQEDMELGISMLDPIGRGDERDMSTSLESGYNHFV